MVIGTRQNETEKIKKVSLSSFLASPMKNGNYWSPFIEIVCNDAVTPKNV